MQSQAGKPGKPNAERAAEIAERRKQLVKMRNDGIDWDTCVERLGYTSVANAAVDLRRALDAAIKEQRETVEQYRMEALGRYDMYRKEVIDVLRKDHPFISNGKVVRDLPLDDNGEPDYSRWRECVALTDSGPVLDAVRTLLKIEDQIAKLTGVNVAIKIQTETTTAITYVVEGVDMGALK